MLLVPPTAAAGSNERNLPSFSFYFSAVTLRHFLSVSFRLSSFLYLLWESSFVGAGRPCCVFFVLSDAFSPVVGHG